MKPGEYRYLAEKPIEFLNEVVIPRIFEAIKKPISLEAYVAWIKSWYVWKYLEASMKIGKLFPHSRRLLV